MNYTFTDKFFHRIFPIPDNASIADLLSDGSNRAFVTDSEYLSFFEKSLNESGKFTKLKENILTNHWGFLFYSNEIIFKAFNRKLPQLIESGIADFIMKNEARAKQKAEEILTVVLTLDHLENWFKLFLILLGVAGIVFAVEFMGQKVFKGRISLFNH